MTERLRISLGEERSSVTEMGNTGVLPYVRSGSLPVEIHKWTEITLDQLLTISTARKFLWILTTETTVLERARTYALTFLMVRSELNGDEHSPAWPGGPRDQIELAYKLIGVT